MSRRPALLCWMDLPSPWLLLSVLLILWYASGKVVFVLIFFSIGFLPVQKSQLHITSQLTMLV